MNILTLPKNEIVERLFECVSKNLTISRSEFLKIYEDEMLRNDIVVEYLEFIENKYKKEKDRIREKAYRTAINTVNKLNIPVSYVIKVKNIKLPGIATGISGKIEEILATGELKAIPIEVKEVERKNITDLFKSLWDVGDVQANEWYDLGYRTLDQIIPFLKPAQMVSFKYLSELQKKIPRKKIDDLNPILFKYLKTLDNTAKFMIAGSYRRGAIASGDIDVLISSTDGPKILNKYVDYLKQKGIVLEILKKGKVHITTISQLDGHIGKIDFVFIPDKSWSIGLIAWTGSQDFVIKMRRVASKKGYILSERELFSKKTGKIYPATEEEVFKILDLPYVEPRKRF